VILHIAGARVRYDLERITQRFFRIALLLSALRPAALSEVSPPRSKRANSLTIIISNQGTSASFHILTNYFSTDHLAL
jgi:hypothetical protein